MKGELLILALKAVSALAEALSRRRDRNDARKRERDETLRKWREERKREREKD
jgi:hypothetical protein